MNRVNAMLLAVLVVCALSVVSAQHQARKLVSALQDEDDFTQELQMEWLDLQTAQSGLATHARVDKMARKTLKMDVPAAEQVRIIDALDQPPRVVSTQ